MNRLTVVAILVASCMGGAGEAGSRRDDVFDLSVIVDGSVRHEYAHRGTNYVEARRGAEYVLRLSNASGHRVAVALSVDGLNTIDARHCSAKDAAKWVLEPWATIEITGWQVSGSEARRFYFTDEGDSYGAWLGEAANLGVIEAVVFREKARVIPVIGWERGEEGSRRRGAGESREPDSAPTPLSSLDAARKAEEFAATGIGERVEHRVEWVSVQLEERPTAVVRIRYEFRPQLERLGVLPPREIFPELDRRESARGFADGYCPDPGLRQ